MSQIAIRINDQQRTFAACYALDPETAGHGTNAAIKAGYAPDSAHVAGSRLLRHPGVRLEIERLTREALGDHASFAVKFLGRVMRDDKAQLKIRVDAAKIILDRAGYVAPKAPEAPDLQEKDHTEMSMAELQALIRRIDAEIAEAKADMIDVTPVETTGAPLALPVPPTS